MELLFVPPDLRRIDETSAEIVACATYEDVLPMQGLAGLLDWRLGARLSRLIQDGFVTGALGEVLCVPARPRLPFDKVLLFGAGRRAEFDESRFALVVASVARALEGLRTRRAVVELPGRSDARVSAERAAEIVLAQIGDSPAHDAWWLVEEAEAEKTMKKRAIEEQRRARHAPDAAAPKSGGA